MRFTPLKGDQVNKGADASLTDRFKSGHTIGPVTISDEFLFVKKGLKRYYIAYSDAEKIFRRVRSLHANICCGDGDIEVEYLVIQADGRELIEVDLPGKKAAQMLMKELKETAPSLDTAAPAKQNSGEEEAS